MTEIQFELNPSPGRIGVRPFDRHNDGEVVHFPAEVTYTLTSGDKLELEPSAPGQAMRIRELSAGGRTRHVLIPASATPVAYANLVEVDPATLDPVATPEVAWWAAIAGMQLTEDPDHPGLYLIGK